MNPFNFLKNSRGQSIIEFALVLPLILSVVLGTVELGNMFLVSLRLSNMSRQVTNAVFRDCAYLPEAAQTGCLTSLVARVRDEGNLLFGDFASRGTVIASTFISEQDRSVRRLGSQSAGAGNHPTRYSPGIVNPELAAGFERLAVGEIFYRYTPLTPVGSFFSFLSEEPVIYEVTIF